MFLGPVLTLVVLLSSLEPAPQAQSEGRTVWAGVFTESQAARGKVAYEASCISCHRDGPRKDAAFLRDWGGSDVEKLFLQTRASMPPGAPASLGDAAYLDIVAYFLLVNGFPAAAEDLRLESIAGLRIEGRNGPEPVANYALVSAVGCLQPGPNATWVLTRASEPARTRNPTISRDDELARAGAAALGGRTLLLLNVYPRPDPYSGHRVEAKGFLIRDTDGDRLNMTSFQTLAPRCER